MGRSDEHGGILLNDEMDDFTTQPGVPNALFGLIQSDANAIAPGTGRSAR